MPAWGWALTALAAALVTLLLALSVPVDFRFRAMRPPRDDARMRVEWLWGLVGFSFAGSPRAVGRATPAKPEMPGGKKRRRRHALPEMAFVLSVLRLGRSLLRAVEVRRLRLQVTFGSEDPIETGLIYAAAVPVSAVLSSVSANTEVVARADFQTPRFEYDLDGWVRIWPLRALFTFALFAAKPSSIRNFARLRRVAA